MCFDPEGLHRAILNVVSNAIDACEEADKGMVTVETEYQPDASLLRIMIRDNGNGIDADQLQRIFNVFVSGKGNRGTGLGLAVSQKILQEHNGEIRAQSQLGHGSQFVLELPAVPMEVTSEFERPAMQLSPKDRTSADHSAPDPDRSAPDRSAPDRSAPDQQRTGSLIDLPKPMVWCQQTRWALTLSQYRRRWRGRVGNGPSEWLLRKPGRGPKLVDRQRFAGFRADCGKSTWN